MAEAVEMDGAVPAAVEIRGPIGEWGVTDRDFIARVEALGRVDTVRVAINSRGGDLDHALAMFDYLRNHPARVVVRVAGVALSSASVVAMAGDYIEMPANAVMMVHNPWTVAVGNASSLRRQAEQLERFEAALRETYMARTGKSEAEIRELLERETFMTAAEAVALGFADAVLPLSETETQLAAVYASALGIPDAVLARLAQAAAGPTAGAGESVDVAGTVPEEGDATAAASETHEPAGAGAAAGPTLVAQVQAACAAAGLAPFARAIALDAAVVDAASLQRAVTEAREVLALAELAGVPEMAARLIERRASLAEARREILAARAAADDALPTDGRFAPVRPSTGRASGGVSVAAIWAARMSVVR